MFDTTTVRIAARDEIDRAVTAKHEQVDVEARQAEEVAEEYARRLAAGDDPLNYPLPDEGDRGGWRQNWRGRSDWLVSPYVGLRVVYAAWHEARGSRNPIEPFQNAGAFRIGERMAESIGTPVLYQELATLFTGSRAKVESDRIAKALLEFERAGDLVVRRVKVDGKVAFLIRERRPDDAPPRNTDHRYPSEVTEERWPS